VHTLAIHAGAQPDPTTGARATPIYQTTSFVFDDVDHAASLFGLQAFGNIYTRIGNPTHAVLEERVAALEGGTAALAVASGHAAQVLVFHTLMEPGDEFIASRRSSMAARSTSSTTLQELRLERRWADPTTLLLREGDHARRPRRSSSSRSPIPAASSPTSRHRQRSPSGRRAADRRQHAGDALPVPPFEHGADIVVHSLTKFLGGHGNSIGGVIVDGGTFDWSGRESGRYPMLSEPRPEYNGHRAGETFGNFAFAIACRVLGLRDLGPASRRSTPS
jgi:O-acetylhomoserine (thiol)-lyase